jgi:hypothetical protein
MKTTDKLYIIDREYKFDSYCEFGKSWRGWKINYGAYRFEVSFDEWKRSEGPLTHKELGHFCDIACTVFNNGEEIGQTTIKNKQANQETIVDSIKTIIRNHILKTNKVESWARNSYD